MNKNIFHGEWNKIKGKIQEHWAELTDDDLLKIKADGQQLYGMIEKKYGYTKEEAKETVDDFLQRVGISTKEYANHALQDIQEIKQTLVDISNSFVSQINELSKKIPERLHKGQEKIERSIESHPWSSLGIIAIIGFLLGVSLSHKDK